MTKLPWHTPHSWGPKGQHAFTGMLLLLALRLWASMMGSRRGGPFRKTGPMEFWRWGWFGNLMPFQPHQTPTNGGRAGSVYGEFWKVPGGTFDCNP